MNKTIALLILLLSIPIVVPRLHAADAVKKKINIALLDFTSNNTTKANAAIIRNKVEVALYATKAFTIVERKNIDLILKEQGFQQTGCTDAECAVQLGKLLSAEYVAVGTVDKLTGYTVTLKIISVGKGTVKFAHSETAPTDNDLQDAINTIAEVAAKEVAGIKVSLPKTKKRDGQDSEKDKKSDSPVFTLRETKKKHFITNFIVAPPVGNMAGKMEMGWGGSIGLQYRDYVVIGIEGAAIQFNSRVNDGQYIHLPLYATLGVNLKFKNLVCLVPYLSGGFSWNWYEGIDKGYTKQTRYLLLLSPLYYSLIQSSTMKGNVFNGTMKTGLMFEIQPGSVVSITLGGYYALIFNRNHAVEYAFGGASLGLNFRF